MVLNTQNFQNKFGQKFNIKIKRIKSFLSNHNITLKDLTINET